jgi:TRAP-type transport system periplasmic protein
MRRLLALKLLFALLIVTLFSLYSVRQSQGADKQIVLKLTSLQASEDPITLALNEWVKEVSNRTQGRVKINFYPSATLAPASQQYDAAVKGIADICNHVLGNTTGRFPLSEVLDLPVGIPSGVVASKMVNEYYRRFKPKEFDEVKVLLFHAQGPGFVCMRSKPVNKIEDLKGLKMRTFGGNVKFMSALGGAPVAMPMTEVYEALSRGMVDGLLSAYCSLENRQIGEFIKYVTEDKSTGYTATFIVAMNKRKWNALPADIQTIMDKLSEEYIGKLGNTWDQADVKARSYLARLGGKSILLSKKEEQRWVEKGAKPVFDEYVTRMKQKGLPGQDALNFMIDFLKASSGS